MDTHRWSRPAPPLTCLLISLFLIASASAAAEPDDLTAGIEAIAAPGAPGCVTAFGSQARVTVYAAARDQPAKPLAAVATFEKGRVAIFGHTDYFNADTADIASTRQWLSRTFDWLANSQNGVTVGVVGEATLPGLFDQVDVEALPRRGWADQLDDVDVLLVRDRSLDEASIEAVQQFVADGGSLMMAETGWGWRQLNQGKSLQEDMPANALLAPMGLAFADGTAPRQRNRIGVLPSTDAPANALDALDGLQQAQNDQADAHPARWRRTAEALVLSTLEVAPPGSAFAGRIDELSRSAELKPATPDAPLSQADGLARIMTTHRIRRWLANPAADQSAYPGAAAFPGSVDGQPSRDRRTISINLQQAGWRPTGRYLPPGGTLVVRASADAADAGLAIRVGAHTDRLYHHDTWQRAPEITVEVPLAEGESRVSSPFGGPVYIDVPRQARRDTSVDLQIGGAVDMPVYDHGRTTAEQWRQQVSGTSAPWAELVGELVILTIPTEVARTLDDPAAVMDHWQRVAEACIDLSGRSVVRPDRFVADTQISAGYMHAGYPIMVPTSTAEDLVDLDVLMARRSPGPWGFYHEIGHNHQNAAWVFDGTSEVNVNLFTLYVLETVAGVEPMDQHNGLRDRQRLHRQARQWFESGRPYGHGNGRAGPWVSLLFYKQLVDAFGWEPFQRVFREYEAAARDALPRNDQEKRDQFLIRLSQAVDRDLGPYFADWRIGVSDDARREVEDLPRWLPDGHFTAE